MATVLQIGAGGVGGVVAFKLAMNKEVFSDIHIASRTLSKCDAIAKNIAAKGYGEIHTHQVDAEDVEALVALINEVKPKVLINVALPYQNLYLMEACLRTQTAYTDTANYENPNLAHYEYKEQWAYNAPFKEANTLAVLGSGFDPGVTNVFVSYANKHYFDQIEYIDIYDCNAGDHGYPFATNFNPEINLREVSSKGSWWEDGKFIETEPMEIMQVWDYPEIGPKDSYLLYHAELESLPTHIPGIKRIRFFMTFSQNYINHMRCLENVGMLRIDEVEHDGHKIIPIQFLKTLLPDPATLAGRTVGKTNIGCYITGKKDGKERTIYIYNVCDHEECYKEVNSQGVSYTAGVPAMITAKLICEGKWSGAGALNIEQMDPDPFMEELNKQGLPWKVLEK